MNSHSRTSITGTDQLESESYTFGHSPEHTEAKEVLGSKQGYECSISLAFKKG